MPDRDQQIKMFNRLVDYIKTNSPHLPLPEQKKFFSSVSTTESTRIFEFLIGRRLPDFQISRLEVDVPEALTILDYPYIRTVTKSALVSVTTRQAVVGLLVIFDWLIKSISFQPKQENFVKDGESVDIDLEFLGNMRLYSDQIQEANLELGDKLYPLHDLGALELKLKQVADEDEQIAADIEVIENDIDAVEILKEDVEKCEKYLDHMSKYIQFRQEEKEKVLKQDTEAPEESSLEERLASIEAKIQAHPLDILELDRLQATEDALATKVTEASIKLEFRVKESYRFEEECRAAREKLRAIVEKQCFLLKDMIRLFDNQEINSKTLTNNRQKLVNWLAKMQQPLPDDTSQILKLTREIELFWQGLEATKPSLESELQDELTELKLGTEDLKGMNQRQLDELSRSGQANDRVTRETDLIKGRHEEEVEKLESLIDDDDRKMSNLQADCGSEVTALDKQYQEELRVLEGDKKNDKVITELNDQRLGKVVERHNSELLAMVRTEEQSLEYWKAVQDKCDRDRRAITQTQKKLKKRQMIN